jgi:glycosyltransferase involved in cell wall biosynthesis
MSVSVIMATYNNEHEIGLAVASILLQDYEDFELVIVNDASTDATPEIVERLAAQDDRVIVLHNERNLGRAMSRNRAIKTARAELIAILDADDIAMPYRLSHQDAYMNTHPEIGMLGGWSIRINALNQPLDLLIGPTQDMDIRRRLQRLRMPFAHSTVSSFGEGCNCCRAL